MKIEKRYIDHNFSHRSRNAKIEYIVVHYAGIAGAMGSASIVSNSLHKSSKSKAGRAASTHYIVGKDCTINLVRDRHRAWHVGAYSTTNKLDTCNDNSLGVDLVECKKDRSSNSVGDNDWYFEDVVIERGAKLVAILADRYNILTSNIVRHYDVTGKKCPRPFVGRDINAVTGAEHNKAWREFIQNVEWKRTKKI